MTNQRLILDTPNRHDLSLADLGALASDLEAVLAEHTRRDVDVVVSGEEPLGAGNNWIDQIFVVLPNAEFIKEAAFTGVVAAVTKFMRTRFKRPHEATRPRRISVQVPDGTVVVVVTLESEDHEAVRVDQDPQ